MENKNPEVLVKSKKRLLKRSVSFKKQLTNQEKAQHDLDEICSKLFEQFIDRDINNKLYFVNGQKQTFYELYEHHKRDLEKKYDLEPFTLTKSIFDHEEVLDAPSNVVNFSTEPINISHEIKDLDIVIEANSELDKLQKKICRAEKTIQKDKNKLLELTRQLNNKNSGLTTGELCLTTGEL
jgi:hypothetical protein